MNPIEILYEFHIFIIVLYLLVLMYEVINTEINISYNRKQKIGLLTAILMASLIRQVIL